MKRLCFLSLAPALILAAATHGAPAPQSPDGAKPAGAVVPPDTLETFRRLLLRQLGAGGTAVDYNTAWTTQPSTTLFDQYSTLNTLTTPRDIPLSQPSYPANQAPGTTIRPTGPLPTPAQSRFYQPSLPSAGLNSAEGIHIANHGILFLGTVHSLPPRGPGKQLTCARCHDAEKPAEAEQPSPRQQADAEWEAIQGGTAPARSRPTPATPTAPPRFCQPSLLSDRLAQLLADHGHRFEQLKPTERITLQLHVRTGELSTFFNTLLITDVSLTDTGTVGSSFNLRNLPLTPSGNRPASNSDPLSAPDGAPAQAPASTPAQDALETFVRRQSALAELHVKEENYEKALAAYHAIAKSTGNVDPAKRATAYRRITELLLRQNKVDEARKVLAEYDDVLKSQKSGAAAKPSRSAATPSARPWTLTLSATKAQCDAVRAGKLSVEDFAKQILVKSSK